jgi:hypothetical protein
MDRPKKQALKDDHSAREGRYERCKISRYLGFLYFNIISEIGNKLYLNNKILKFMEYREGHMRRD